MWPFKRKRKNRYVRAKAAGVVDKVMYDHVIISGRKYSCRVMLVEVGQIVTKKQPVGKK